MGKKEAKNKVFLGAHYSIAGSISHALVDAKNDGASCLQIFTANQKRWSRAKQKNEEVLKFNSLRKEYQLNHLMSHASYLINIGSPKDDLKEKSTFTFCEEIKSCHQLNIDYLCFHPGAATTESEEDCLEAIVDSLIKCKGTILSGKTLILMETTAGQGTVVGWKFSQLGYILKNLPKDLQEMMGVCLDTCHVFSAGYDIRTKDGWDKTLDEFNNEVGLDNLKAIHVNDSMKELGSRKDRHASLGKGYIGLESFEVMMKHPDLQTLPKYLETPMPEIWKEEILLLQSFAHNKIAN